MPYSGVAGVRRGQAALGVTGPPRRLTANLIRGLIVVGLGLAAWQAWSSFTAETPAPAPPAIPGEFIVSIQITLGQAALALRDFGKSGLVSDRFDFEQNMSRVRRSVETLEGPALELEERQALGRVRSLLERLGQIEKEHIVRVDAGGGGMGADKLAEIARLRDEAALALTDVREVGRRRIVVAEPASVTRLVRGSAGLGAGLLSLCIAAITLWNRLFPD